MRLRLHTVIFLLAFATLAVSCNKKDTTSPNNTTNNNNNNNNNNTQNQTPAKLKLTLQVLQNGGGMADPYATVQLFKTEDDRKNNTNPASPVTTADASGVVLFDNLEPIDYYFNATSSDGTKSNAKGGTHSGALTRGATKSLTIVMQ